MLVYGVKIKRFEIREYFTDEILKCVDFYWKVKMYGLPFSGGWAEQPAFLMRIIFLLDNEMEKRKRIDGKRSR